MMGRAMGAKQAINVSFQTLTSSELVMILPYVT